MKKIGLLLIIFAFIFFSFVYAHSGRTDSNGGHYDSSAGEYHYHHGYSAHQHINGVCPYENTNTYSFSNNSKETFEFTNNDSELLADLSKEYQKLEDENYELKEELNEYKNQLEDANVNSIQELFDLIEKNDNKISNYNTLLIIMGIIILVLSINLYTNRKDFKK